jgi:putative ABC transport system permease protein
MFKSYLKLALRNLWKRKTTTAINVLSLSVGLASCALVFLFCQHELSFDKGFDNNDDIYRVTSNFSDGSKAPTTALPFYKYLKSEIPEIEQLSRLDINYNKVKGGSQPTPFSVDAGYWVDPQFFKIFSFHFLYGNRKTAFDAPNTAVISQSLSQKLFGHTYPIGKTLKAGSNTFTVTGVFKEDFLNHLKPDFFASYNSDQIRESVAKVTNWVIDPNYYLYIRLKHGSNLQHVLTELNAYTKRHAAADMKASGDIMTNSLQALKDIHLYSSGYTSAIEYRQGNIKYLYLLGAIALIILILGCINYMNLTTAQAIGRAREVGVRRVLGAGKGSIRYQFFMETIAISLCAMVVAIGLAFLFLPIFNTIAGQALSFFAPENRSLILWVLLITLITGLLAGIYPAFYLSSFKAVKVLKGKASESSGIFSIRKLLIVSQFVISTCLVFATIVVWNQVHFMINADPGFDQDQQLVINLNTDQAKKNGVNLISQLKNNANFKSVTGAMGDFISGDMNLYPAEKTVRDKHDIFLDFTDENYVRTLGLKLISGSNFTPVTFTNTNTQAELEVNDIGRQVILNEEAAKALGLDPYTAPGKYVSHLHNGIVYNYKIMGVVKNYHYFSLHAIIGPCAIMPANPLWFTTIIAKINGRNSTAAIKYATQKWKNLNPDAPFPYRFLNNDFTYDYVQDQHEQQMSSIFTAIAIFVSCLGLLGLVTYSVTQKAREIGIRKVVGASVSNIVLLFTKQYLKLILIANLIAWPLAWYLMNTWLQGFPYRVQISWWMFAVSLSAGIIIAFSTIAFKTIKAVMANPVNSLRAE